MTFFQHEKQAPPSDETMDILAMDKDGCMIPPEQEAAFLGTDDDGFSAAVSAVVLSQDHYDLSTIATQAPFLKVQLAQIQGKLGEPNIFPSWVNLKFRIPVDTFQAKLASQGAYLPSSMLAGHYEAFANDNFNVLKEFCESGLANHMKQPLSLIKVLNANGEECHEKPSSADGISVVLNTALIDDITASIDDDNSLSDADKTRQKTALTALAEQYRAESTYLIETHYHDLTQTFDPPENKAVLLQQLLQGTEGRMAKDINLTFVDDNYANYFELALDKMSHEEITAAVAGFLETNADLKRMFGTKLDGEQDTQKVINQFRRVVTNINSDKIMHDAFQFLCHANQHDDAILRRANVQFIHALPKEVSLFGGSAPSFVLSAEHHRLALQSQMLSPLLHKALAERYREAGNTEPHLSVLLSKKFEADSPLADVDLQDDRELLRCYFAGFDNLELTLNSRILKIMLERPAHELEKLLPLLNGELTPLETQMMHYFEHQQHLYELAKDPHAIPSDTPLETKPAAAYSKHFEWAGREMQRLEAKEASDFIQTLRPDLQLALVCREPAYTELLDKDAFVAAISTLDGIPGSAILSPAPGPWLSAFDVAQQARILSAPCLQDKVILNKLIHCDDARQFLAQAQAPASGKACCLRRLLSPPADNVKDNREFARDAYSTLEASSQAEVVRALGNDSHFWSHIFPKDAAESQALGLPDTLNGYSTADIQQVSLGLFQLLRSGQQDTARDYYQGLDRRQKLLIYSWFEAHNVHVDVIDQLANRQHRNLATEVYDGIEWRPARPRFIYMKGLAKSADFDSDTGYLFKEMLYFFSREETYEDMRLYLKALPSDFKAALFQEIIASDMDEVQTNLVTVMLRQNPALAADLSAQQISQVEERLAVLKSEGNLDDADALEVELLKRKGSLIIQGEKTLLDVEAVIDDVWEKIRTYRNDAHSGAALDSILVETSPRMADLEQTLDSLLTSHRLTLSSDGAVSDCLLAQRELIDRNLRWLDSDIQAQTSHLLSAKSVSPGAHVIGKDVLERMQRLQQELQRVQGIYDKAIAHTTPTEPASIANCLAYQNVMRHFVAPQSGKNSQAFNDYMQRFEEASQNNPAGYSANETSALVRLNLTTRDTDAILYSKQTRLLDRVIPSEGITATKSSTSDVATAMTALTAAARSLYDDTSKRSLKSIKHDRTYILKSLATLDMNQPDNCIKVFHAFDKLSQRKQASLQAMLSKEVKHHKGVENESDLAKQPSPQAQAPGEERASRKP